MKKNYFLMLLALAFLLANCRTETLSSEQENQPKYNYNISVLNNKHLETRTGLLQEVEKLKTHFFKNADAKVTAPQDSILEGAIIETDHVLEITAGTKKTYTIPISRTFPNNKIENLVLRENPDKTYSGLLFQYNLTQEEKDRYKNGQPVDLSGKIKSYSITNLSVSGKGSTYSYWDGCMEYIYETNPCTAGGNHSYGDGGCEALGTGQSAQPASLISAIDHCAEGSSGGGGGGGSSGGGWIGGGGSTGGGSTGGGSGGTSGGSGGYIDPNGNPYNTFIFFSFDDMFNMCPENDMVCEADRQLNIQVQKYLLSLNHQVSSLASYNQILFTIKEYFLIMGYEDNNVLTEKLALAATWFNAQNNTDPNVRLNNYKFASFILQFLITNPDTTWLQFESWFLNPEVDSDILNEVKNYITETGYALPTYTVNNFPGKDDGMPFEWWKDNNWIKNNIRLDELRPDEEPNSTEKMLFVAFPTQAAFHIKNSKTALNTVNQLVSDGTFTGIHNGKADAFRHTFWNALDSSDFGKTITLLFTSAHEKDSGNHPLETQMDLHNNTQGAQLGANYSTFTAASTIKNAVIEMMQNSNNIWYLTPLYWNASHTQQDVIITTGSLPSPNLGYTHILPTNQ